MAGHDARVIAASEPEDLPISAKELARQHLLAELQGRQFSGGAMPHRVEVRVWEDRAEGDPGAVELWALGDSLLRPSEPPTTTAGSGNAVGQAPPSVGVG
ncbi:hypothetical protein [Streptacidiphilus jiangxiensis]|uniref:hypothetical protein n=1 Tax=Streptacidiphilus jiangxiensis TaxID=235985 RepID=UPI000B0B9B34|nr:hypothetical protein [Streptacidiphilus jiangxiensis]